jgi:hypothetical protein
MKIPPLQDKNRRPGGAQLPDRGGNTMPHMHEAASWLLALFLASLLCPGGANSCLDVLALLGRRQHCL